MVDGEPKPDPDMASYNAKELFLRHGGSMNNVQKGIRRYFDQNQTVAVIPFIGTEFVQLIGDESGDTSVDFVQHLCALIGALVLAVVF